MNKEEEEEEEEEPEYTPKNINEVLICIVKYFISEKNKNN